MNMRVDERIAAESARQTAEAGEAQRTRAANAGAAGAGTPAGNADRLQISTLASGIRDTFDGLAQSHAARLEQLGADVRAGRYQVDPAALSRAMVSRALGEIGS
jgi:anti-sigma28 factor (negative regulator of flagellin synthesis)